jgi:hypothetical protein
MDNLIFLLFLPSHSDFLEKASIHAAAKSFFEISKAFSQKQESPV